jgi:hypothetical protein
LIFDSIKEAVTDPVGSRKLAKALAARLLGGCGVGDVPLPVCLYLHKTVTMVLSCAHPGSCKAAIQHPLLLTAAPAACAMALLYVHMLTRWHDQQVQREVEEGEASMAALQWVRGQGARGFCQPSRNMSDFCCAQYEACWCICMTQLLQLAGEGGAASGGEWQCRGAVRGRGGSGGGGGGRAVGGGQQGEGGVAVMGGSGGSRSGGGGQ